MSTPKTVAASAAGALGSAVGLSQLPKLIESMPHEYGLAGAGLAVLAWAFWLMHSQALSEIRINRKQITEVLTHVGVVAEAAAVQEVRLSGLEAWFAEVRQDIREARRARENGRAGLPPVAPLEQE